MAKTVETVFIIVRVVLTGLKPGENERRRKLPSIYYCSGRHEQSGAHNDQSALSASFVSSPA
jgi:hypothetical protein